VYNKEWKRQFNLWIKCSNKFLDKSQQTTKFGEKEKKKFLFVPIFFLFASSFFSLKIENKIKEELCILLSNRDIRFFSEKQLLLRSEKKQKNISCFPETLVLSQKSSGRHK
jgi:hypothetical protein